MLVEEGVPELRLLECLMVAKLHQLSVIPEADHYRPPFLIFYLNPRDNFHVVGGVALNGEHLLSLGIITVDGRQDVHVALIDAVLLLQVVDLFGGQVLYGAREANDG
jgi:hypothetical protein